MSVFISVFTATYNRAYCLNRAYESLLQQTYKNFEWVIVDDGSNDGSNELISNWIREGKLKITYYYQINQGKPSAWNLGLDLAKGELFVNLDSDDYLLPEAISIFKSIWEKIENKKEFYGVVGLTIDSNGTIVGDKFPLDIFDSNSIELHNVYHINGEKRGALVTSILRNYKFPKFEGEKFVPEGLIWIKVAKKYNQRYFNIPVTIYDSRRLDSLTVNMGLLRYRNKLGYLAYYHELSNLSNIPFVRRFKYNVGYYAMKLHCYKTLEASSYNKLFAKNNSFITLPASICGFVLFILDICRYSKKVNN